MAVQDMCAGDGLALIDPKGDLVNDVLARAPEDRRKDVVLIDLVQCSQRPAPACAPMTIFRCRLQPADDGETACVRTRPMSRSSRRPRRGS
jgi:hypothetical protein